MQKTILIFLLLLANYSLSQSKGYFGKNNIIEFSINAQNPALYNLKISNNNSSQSNTALIKKNNELIPGYPQINYGYRLSYGRMIERNLGFYLESGLNFFSVVPDQNINSFFYENLNGSNYSNLNAEMTKIQEISIIPKIEISSRDGLLPIGISNQFGIGFNFYKPIEKSYLGTVDYINDTVSISNLPIDKNNFYNYSNSSIKGYTFLYKLALRIPISKKALFHFGFRYTLNFVPNSAYIANQKEIISQDNMRQMIKLKENRNLLNFETGISFCF
jgi:hypothetical protein